MQASLTFRPLTAPVSKKTLTSFRKDAGWSASGDEPNAGAAKMGGRLQWVSVEAGKRMVGIARLELAPPQFCYVSDLIVLSTFRGRGVGDWFMKNIERFCVQSGIPRVLLVPHEGTHGFYEKLHFVADPNVVPFFKKDLNPFQRKILAY